jgi:hypothetical protein
MRLSATGLTLPWQLVAAQEPERRLACLVLEDARSVALDRRTL